MSTNVRNIIYNELTMVLRDAGKPAPALVDDQLLMAGGLGLDSLDFAVLVVRLEQQLHYDPFNSAALDRFPVNLGELVALYESLPTPAGATE